MLETTKNMVYIENLETINVSSRILGLILKHMGLACGPRRLIFTVYDVCQNKPTTKTPEFSALKYC